MRGFESSDKPASELNPPPAGPGLGSRAAEQWWGDVLMVVDEQANDDGLWFVAQTAPEAYLQQELRRLHAAIEEANR